MPVPPVCQPIEVAISNKQKDVNRCTKAVQNAQNRQERQAALEDLREAQNELAELERELQQCVDANKPRIAPVLSTFTARARLLVQHLKLPDPFVADIVVPLEFSGDDERYRVVTALGLPTFDSRIFNTPLGDSTTTIQLEYPRAQPGIQDYRLPTPAGFLGYFLPNGHPGGRLPWAPESIDSLPARWMQLYSPDGWIRHSLSLGDWFQLDSKFGGWWTEGVMKANGDIDLLRRGTFGGGVLNGRPYEMQISGNVSPRP